MKTTLYKHHYAPITLTFRKCAVGLILLQQNLQSGLASGKILTRAQIDALASFLLGGVRAHLKNQYSMVARTVATSVAPVLVSR